MRNLSKATLLTTVLTATAISGAAQADMYFEAGLTQISDDIDGSSISHYGATGIFGTTLNATETFAHKIEGIVFLGLNSDEYSGIDVKLQSMIGAAYRPTIKLNDAVELHARIGLFNGRVKAKASRFGYSDTDLSTEAGFGVGVDFKWMTLSYLNVDGTSFVTAAYRF